jgi:RNA polymerase II subunit A-like phosphatase
MSVETQDQLQPIQIHASHYPIQIKTWKVKVGDSIRKDQVLGMYEYIETIDDASFTRRAEIRVAMEGSIHSLAEIDFISQSEQYFEFTRQPLGWIQEICSHSVQLHGLCALCGKDLTISHYTGSDIHRATINLTHDSKGVKISHKAFSVNRRKQLE